MIKLEKVSKVYTLVDQEVHAVKDINLEIKEGEYSSILGTSGSGKSTLMHIIGLLDKPTSGKVNLFGKNVFKLEDDELSSLRNKYIGFVFQQYNLIEKLTILENAVLPTIYTKEKLDFNPEKRGLEVLERLGIKERANFYPNQLSGGQQQRAAIARSIIMKPKLLLADEPTGNLDTNTGNEILKLLDELNKETGATVVIVTHDKYVANRTKRQIYIKDGEITDKYL